MKNYLIPFNFLTFLCSNFAFAQNYTDFLPLQVGNVWVYQCSTNGQWCGGCTGRTRVSVVSQSVINGKTYYQSQVTANIISGACYSNYCGTQVLPFTDWIRIDSQSANVLWYTASGCQWSPNEIMLDSLRAQLHDSVSINCQRPVQWQAYVCTNTSDTLIFGSNRQRRAYTYYAFEGGAGRGYVRGIGVYIRSTIALEGGTYVCFRQMNLRGCVINGILYGDTSMLVGIKQISTEVPIDYALYQNFPNPFNPVTKIQFAVSPEFTPPEAGKGDRGMIVRLVIYDILGREVATLINEQLKPGTYEVEWTAANYPSGVYYYKLTAGDFSETRKMVLLK
jgi:Secretion system C-terminal sorting domain